MGGISFDCLIG